MKTMTSNRRRLAVATLLVACTAGVLTGCGDDDDTAGTTSTTAAADSGTPSTAPKAEEVADHSSVCAAYSEVSTAFNSPEPPDPAAIQPTLDTLKNDAPDDIADSLGVMVSAAQKVVDSQGEDFSAFEAPEFATAQSEVDPFMFENCEYDTKLEVVGKEYAFEGLPATLEAGLAGILFTNEGVEAHEIGVARKKAGVTDEWEAILALPEEEAMAKIDLVGGAFAPSKGDQSLLIAELEPGDYAAVCFVPTGTTMDESGEHPGEGQPHFMQGMLSEFTVS